MAEIISLQHTKPFRPRISIGNRSTNAFTAFYISGRRQPPKFLTKIYSRLLLPPAAIHTEKHYLHKHSEEKKSRPPLKVIYEDCMLGKCQNQHSSANVKIISIMSNRQSAKLNILMNRTPCDLTDCALGSFNSNIHNLFSDCEIVRLCLLL